MVASNPSRPNSLSVQAKKPLTPEQKAQRQIVAKVRRLNLKLSKVKEIASSMNDKSSKANQFSARQVESWAKEILSIINKPEIT